MKMYDLDGKKVGVTDTMYARYDMGQLAIDTLREHSDVSIERYTVPGYNEQPLACKRLVEEYDCDIVIAVGMASPYSHNKDYLQTASRGFQQVSLETGVHVLEVFVAEDEAKSKDDLIDIIVDRVTEHSKNALDLLDGKETMTPRAGKGIRQGGPDAGPLRKGGE